MATLDDEVTPLTGPDGRLDSTNMRAHAIRGSAWTMAWRWCARLIGLVSTAILARLLTPTDFGIYAMAMLVVQLIGIFGEAGQGLALIRLGTPSREHYDTAWTMQVMIYTFLAACVVACAPIAGRYFNSETVEVVVYFLSLRLFATGFTNIAIVAFRIELDYAKDFRFGVYQKLITAIVTISCAIYFRDYWALAISVVLAKIVIVALSYGMHPYRPRFGLSKVRELWSYSLWMLVVYVSEFFARKTDEFVVGATSNASAMGAYNVGADLAVMPTAEFIEPIARALFPVYSRLLNDPARLRSAVLMVIGATATICFATGPGVASIAREFTLLVLGSQWGEAAPLVFWLAIGAIPYGMNYNIYAVLSVTNNARLTAISIWARVVLLVPTLIVAAAWGGTPAIAAAQALVGFIVLAIDFWMLARAVDLGLRDIVGCLYRPIVASVLMILLLDTLGNSLEPSLVLSMVIKIGCGAVAYISCLMVAWWIVGRPDGVESVAISTVVKMVRNRTGLTS